MTPIFNSFLMIICDFFVCLFLFCQVVWNATTSVGAGLATIGPDASGAIQTYIVARYYPQGNILGVFGQNVFEPVGPW